MSLQSIVVDYLALSMGAKHPMTMNHISLAVISAISLIMPVNPAVSQSAQINQPADTGQIDQPGVFRVQPQTSVEINRHGVCKIVENLGAQPVMVPTGSAAEWSAGDSAFLPYISGRQDFKIQDCSGISPACFFWVSGILPGNDTYMSVDWRQSIGNQFYYEIPIGLYDHDYWLSYATTPDYVPPATGVVYPWAPPDRIDVAKERVGATDPHPISTNGNSRTSGIVAAGDYPDSRGTAANPGPFYYAAMTTFDSIAIGSGTTVEIFTGKNYTGKKYTFEGPVVLVNRHWGSPGYSAQAYDPSTDWSTNPDPLISQFTPGMRNYYSDATVDTVTPGSARAVALGLDPVRVPFWSMEDGSVKVSCD